MDSQDQKLGISLVVGETTDDDRAVFVDSIDATSMFANTPLRVNDEVESINAVVFGSRSELTTQDLLEAMKVIQKATTEVALLARRRMR